MFCSKTFNCAAVYLFNCLSSGSFLGFFFLWCALFLLSSGTEEPYRRAAGQRWEEQRARWRVSQRPLLQRQTPRGLLSAPPPPPPPTLPQLPTAQLALLALHPTPQLQLPPLLRVLAAAAAAVVVLIQAVHLLVLALLLLLLVLEDWQCLKFLFTVACLIARRYRWVDWGCDVALTCSHTPPPTVWTGTYVDPFFFFFNIHASGVR